MIKVQARYFSYSKVQVATDRSTVLASRKRTAWRFLQETLGQIEYKASTASSNIWPSLPSNYSVVTMVHMLSKNRLEKIDCVVVKEPENHKVIQGRNRTKSYWWPFYCTWVLLVK